MLSALNMSGDSAKELKNIIKAKKMSIGDSMLLNNKDARKIILNVIKTLADNGNTKAAELLQKHIQLNRDYMENATKLIATDEELKAGLLEAIKSEFPLKAVSSGEETMAIGPYSLDKFTLKEIFGTDDYNQIKENLITHNEESGNPYLGYQASVDSKIIPLAKIKIREDGVGYKGGFKLEMQLHSSFAKELENSNKQIYGAN
jgi:hypothetical protein